MKNLYYASFVPGMQEVIAALVRERFSGTRGEKATGENSPPRVSIVKLLDGAVIFETDCSYDSLNFFCFNNIFALIDILDTAPGAAAGVPEFHIRKITGGVRGGFSPKALALISENNKKIKTFRVVCSLENKPASINESAKRDIENFIAGNSALKPDRSGPDTEFWFLYRREGFSLFMKRLTRSVEKKLRPGELPPQLAWLLCRLAEPKQGETALDPFCGYGAIPEAALKHFPVGKFIALDIDARCVKITRERRSLKGGRCEIQRADFFSAAQAPGESAFLPEGGIGAIITDPPWGMYKETKIPLGEFYQAMLTLFLRLLKPGGRAVILTGARAEFESAAAKIPVFIPEKTIPVLVSGKKAAVYIMTKDKKS